MHKVEHQSEGHGDEELVKQHHANALEQLLAIDWHVLACEIVTSNAAFFEHKKQQQQTSSTTTKQTWLNFVRREQTRGMTQVSQKIEGRENPKYDEVQDL